MDNQKIKEGMKAYCVVGQYQIVTVTLSKLLVVSKKHAIARVEALDTVCEQTQAMVYLAFNSLSVVNGEFSQDNIFLSQDDAKRHVVTLLKNDEADAVRKLEAIRTSIAELSL